MNIRLGQRGPHHELHLMVFAPEAAPEGREAFMDWYDNLTDWGEGDDYNDPANTSPKLRDWYRDMISAFPAMNGPDGRIEAEPTNRN